MTIINETTVAVSSDLELKEILENDNSYNYIYFENDIVLSSGISISSKKSTVIIDGTYNGVTYKYTDQKKLGTSDTININSSVTKQVTIKNMIITGYNYYGVVYVPEAEKYKDTVVEYNNITYVGPQISFHPMGLTRFIDCNITIQENYVAGNEVAECNKIEIGGTTDIIHNSTGNSAFWFRNQDQSFTILKKSIVSFISKSRELFYGTNNLLFKIEANASFSVTANNGLAYGTNGTGTTLIDEDASFSLKKTNYSGAYATWYSYGVITLNKNSSLDIINNYSKITASNYNIYFQGANSGLVLNNPAKVVLYNTVANVINTNNTSIFNFSYNRINLFDNIVAIDGDVTKDTLPTYSWYKKLELSNVSGTFTSAKTIIDSNNYTSEELQTLPDLSNYNIINKKILSVGIIPLHIFAVTDTDTEFRGVTDKNASVLIEYNDVSTTVVADDLGNFSYSYDEALPIGTIIVFTVKENNNLIYYTKSIEIVYTGELTLDSATKHFEFSPSIIKSDPIICPRLTELIITVTDSRVNSSTWKLYAIINHDLESSDGKILKDSLVFIDKAGNINLLSDTKTLIYSGDANDGVTKTTNIEWNDDEGILLQLKNQVEANTVYTAEITWILEEE